MSLDSNKSTSTFKPRPIIPDGRHIARNYGVIDLGTQMVSFKGNPAEPKPMVMLQFEFPKFMHLFEEEKGMQPLVTSQEYTFYATDKGKLCKVLKSWGKLKEFPKKLNLNPYLGQWCEIKMEHTLSKKDSSITYSNIADGGKWIDALSDSDKASLPKTPPAGCHQNLWFDLDNFSWEIFDKIPKWIQKKIEASREWPTILSKHARATSGQEQSESAGITIDDGSAPAF